MTVYKAIKPEADAAAEMLSPWPKEQEIPSGLVNGKTDNGNSKTCPRFC